MRAWPSRRLSEAGVRPPPLDGTVLYLIFTVPLTPIWCLDEAPGGRYRLGVSNLVRLCYEASFDGSRREPL